MFFENKEHYNPKLMALTLSFFMVTFIIGRNGVKFFSWQLLILFVMNWN